MRALNYALVEALSVEHGDSFYVFDAARFRENFRALQGALVAEYPKVRIGYSYKTNYTPAICRQVNYFGGLAEVVSAMEWEIALRVGVEPHNIIYNGPNKSQESFAAAHRGGALVQLDNARDWQMLQDLAANSADEEFHFGIRVNFDLDGGISRFGMDLGGELFREIVRVAGTTPSLVLDGIHCHFPNRPVETFAKRVHELVAVAHEFFPLPPRYLNIGGGYYGQLGEELAGRFGVESVSFSDYARAVGPVLRQAYPNPDDCPTLLVEPGTALVADSMRFFTRVIDVRRIRGRSVATVDGSLFNTSPYSRFQKLPFEVFSVEARSSDRKCDVAGFTCIESDLLMRDLPSALEVGDFISFGNVGSYSITMKPPFILPSPPILQTSDWQSFSLVRRAERVDDLLASFEL